MKSRRASGTLALPLVLAPDPRPATPWATYPQVMLFADESRVNRWEVYSYVAGGRGEWLGTLRKFVAASPRPSGKERMRWTVRGVAADSEVHRGIYTRAEGLRILIDSHEPAQT